ncbi:MAG TPA: hypothetical protein VKD22_11535 [Ramlibacter sp.]|nr:hypothetical protein [Ramlibacter sp.]
MSEAPESLVLKVVGQAGGEVQFRMKCGSPLKKLMDSYCQRQSISCASVRFLWNGQRVSPEDTPSGLGMQDRDILDAILAQTGG